MFRIAIPTRDNSPTASQPLLDAVGKQVGFIPNLFRLVGLSPAALQAYLGFSAPLTKALDVKTRERIALAVAGVNGCDYCLTAHSYIGLNLAKLDADEIMRNRAGGSGDPKAHAAVRFAAKVATDRGKVSDQDLLDIRAAGFSDAPIVEIVALVAENVFTNFINNVARTDIDFPAIDIAVAA